MLTVAEIRDVKFSRAVGGYKPDDVDVLLDKVEADYEAYDRKVKELEQIIETLNSEVEGFKNSQSSIQNVLVSAQGLADKIVEEAKQKSEEIIKQAENSIVNITSKEKELSAAFELKAQEQKGALEKELKAMVETAQKKADAITLAAEDRVKHQQMLFDKLKLEIVSFKNSISGAYKEHLEGLSKLPDSVPGDPKYIAEVLATSFDKIEMPSQKQAPVEEVPTEEPPLEPVDISSTTESNGGGFVIENESSDEEE